MLNKSSIVMALSLALSSYTIAATPPVVESKISLGILKPDNSGSSEAWGVSADGSTVVGTADIDNIYFNAFIWREATGMTSLGTMKSDNSGYSEAWGVSADGSTVVGESVTDGGGVNAFIWREATGMTSLGTLRPNNSGYSWAYGVSADGSTVVGESVTDGGGYNAFIWREATGMTGLGTLRSDNGGTSRARGISADGSTVVGAADTDNGYRNAFIWREATGMTSLGTLRPNNSGYSDARGVSADGSTVVGFSDADGGGGVNAFIWREATGMTSLGTMRSDNGGNSQAWGVSADGSTVVGYADIDNGYYNAFIWREATGMTGLGTLRSDSNGFSEARGVSADGSVVVGWAETDSGNRHAAVWKVKYPVPPVTPPVTPPVVPPMVTIVDATNSGKSMVDTGRRGFKVLGLYQNSLNSLNQSRCQLGQSDHCIGVFSQYDTISSNHRIATGLFGALRLPVENWTVGGAINFANGTKLVDNYDSRGSNQPGMGVFTRYQQHLDNTGLSAEISGAFLQQGVTITRDKQQNTEAGKGDSRIKGYQMSLRAQYVLAVSPSTAVSPEVSLTHRRVTRNGYTETRNAEFAATYGRMRNTRTELQAGVSTAHHLSETVQLEGNLGAKVKLHSKRDAFTGRIPYIGAYAYDAGDERTVSPYVSAGINVNVTKNSTVRANAGWQQTDYRHDAASIGVSYSYHW